jgi:hypothetical protein
VKVDITCKVACSLAMHRDVGKVGQRGRGMLLVHSGANEANSLAGLVGNNRPVDFEYRSTCFSVELQLFFCSDLLEALVQLRLAKPPPILDIQYWTFRLQLEYIDPRSLSYNIAIHT